MQRRSLLVGLAGTLLTACSVSVPGRNNGPTATPDIQATIQSGVRSTLGSGGGATSIAATATAIQNSIQATVQAANRSGSVVVSNTSTPIPPTTARPSGIGTPTSTSAADSNILGKPILDESTGGVISYLMIALKPDLFAQADPNGALNDTLQPVKWHPETIISNLFEYPGDAFLSKVIDQDQKTRSAIEGIFVLPQGILLDDGQIVQNAYNRVPSEIQSQVNNNSVTVYLEKNPGSTSKNPACLIVFAVFPSGKVPKQLSDHVS